MDGAKAGRERRRGHEPRTGRPPEHHAPRSSSSVCMVVVGIVSQLDQMTGGRRTRRRDRSRAALEGPCFSSAEARHGEERPAWHRALPRIAHARSCRGTSRGRITTRVDAALADHIPPSPSLHPRPKEARRLGWKALSARPDATGYCEIGAPSLTSALTVPRLQRPGLTRLRPHRLPTLSQTHRLPPAHTRARSTGTVRAPGLRSKCIVRRALDLDSALHGCDAGVSFARDVGTSR
jgi:hypothetical protein